MASTRELAINIVGDSKSAVGAFDDVGNAAERTQGKFDKAKAGITIASAAIVAGVVAFGTDSIAAFSEAEQSQAALVAAYEKFPAVASTSIDALRELNTEIQKKTGYDDDALAASQATLAQFGLTGEQIEQLTPLMADYAAKTGKDIETAAQDMGKAIMGQGRALKTVGVDFTDTGNAAGNFDQLVAGLDGTVGGFAETMGNTAAGKAKILEQSFGDIQETVGEMLIPVLSTLVEVGTTVTTWMAENPDIVQALAIAVGILTVAIVAANIAMWALSANPIVLIIMAIIVAVGLLIAAIWFLVTNWEQIWFGITLIWNGFMGWLTGVIDGFVGWWNGIWSAVGSFIGDVWNNIVSAVTGYFTNLWLGFQIIGNAISSWWNGLWSGISSFFTGIWDGILAAIRNVQTAFGTVFNAIAGIIRGAFDGVVGIIRGVINGIIDAVNGVIGGINSVAGAIGAAVGVSISVPRIPRLAQGGVTTGPMLAMIGDNPGGREYVEPVDRVADRLERVAIEAARSAGGDVKVIVTNKTGVALEEFVDIRIERAGQSRKVALASGRRKG